MVVDLRHETAALTPLTAGNYERHHETNPENQTDPGAVRRSFEQSRGRKCKPQTFKVGDLLCLPKFSFFSFVDSIAGLEPAPAFCRRKTGDF